METNMIIAYKKLEEELNKYKNASLDAERKIEECLSKAEKAEEEMNRWRAEAEKVDTETRQIRINVKALEDAMAALQTGDFAPSEEERKTEERERAKIERAANAKVKPVKNWMRAKGEIGQFKPNGEIMNVFTSQKSVAIGLRWDQSSVSRFMKLNRETQIRKKSFYLEYMGT